MTDTSPALRIAAARTLAEPGRRPSHGIESMRLENRTWSDVAVQSSDVTLSGGEARRDLSSRRDVLSIVLEVEGGGLELRHRIDKPMGAHTSTPQVVSLVPGGMPIWGIACGATHLRSVRLEFELSKMAEALGEDLDRGWSHAPCLTFRSDAITRLGNLLSAECEEADSMTRLCGEGLVIAIFTNLLRARQTQGDHTRKGLTAGQLRAATDYLREHLSMSVGLKELAGVTGLSQSQFGRAFKASTGLPPHRWLMSERIAKAQRLICTNKLTLTEIALVLGFTDQSHFSRTFHQWVGASPSAWRHDRKT